MGWAVILAYVCFGLGALLILIGLVRVTYYGCAVRKDKKERQKIQDYYNFNSHKTDPWLKSNPLVTNRLEVSHADNDSLKDIDIQRFNKVDDADSLTESQQGDFPRARTEQDVEHAYHTIPNQSIVYGREMRLDSETLSRNAHYEEPNTNLVLAKKHQQPDNLQEILSETVTRVESPTQQINAKAHHPELKLKLDSSLGRETQVSTVTMNGEPASARSLDTREAFEALDFATAGESYAITPRSEKNLGVLEEEEGEERDYGKSSRVPTTPSGNISVVKIATDEPLPAKDEVEYKYEHAITSF